MSYTNNIGGEMQGYDPNEISFRVLTDSEDEEDTPSIVEKQCTKAQRLIAESNKLQPSMIKPDLHKNDEQWVQTEEDKIELAKIFHSSPQSSQKEKLISIKLKSELKPQEEMLQSEVQQEKKKSDISYKKRFQCLRCYKTFTKSTCLSIHLKTHTGLIYNNIIIEPSIQTHTKPYKCGQCSKAFMRHGHLNVHLRTHTGEKPNKCNYCQKSFADSSNLGKHIRTHIEKSYKCGFCQMTFHRAANLTEHERTHTGEKPYKCMECPKSYPRRGDLTKHLTTHTKEFTTLFRQELPKLSSN